MNINWLLNSPAINSCRPFIWSCALHLRTAGSSGAHCGGPDFQCKTLELMVSKDCGVNGARGKSTCAPAQAIGQKAGKNSAPDIVL